MSQRCQAAAVSSQESGAINYRLTVKPSVSAGQERCEVSNWM
ncbi:hypothetical protein [Leptothermofonsia sichuanensis]|nr:hypothetical protein [Leptothermofonsia sichuanensis]